MMFKLERHGFPDDAPFFTKISKMHLLTVSIISDQIGFRFCLNWFSRLSLNHCF